LGFAIVGRGDKRSVRFLGRRRANLTLETIMANEKGPNVKKKAKCKNCEGKGLVKKGDKVVKCQRCHGTGLR
jgi:DnaJ-class molecular chaperone